MNSNWKFLTFEEFQNKFEIKANYLHYFQLIATIPPDLKRKAFGLELYFLFIFIFCTGIKENQWLKEANKGLDWLVSLIDMYFPYNALVVKYCPFFKCCLFMMFSCDPIFKWLRLDKCRAQRLGLAMYCNKGFGWLFRLVRLRWHW